MDPKLRIIKSKSSNSTVTTKSDKRNQKSRSNVELLPQTLKKRGVYVERKYTKLSIDNTVANQPTNTDELTNQQDKATIKPKSRPGRKKFVGSVLTILSKSTTGTQFPDATEERKKQPVKSKLIPKKGETSYGPVLDNPPKTKQKKFRSKVLHNIEVNEKNNEAKLLVLKSRKDVIESPSNYSDANSFRLPEDLPFIRTNNKINLINNDFRSKTELAEEVLQGKKRKGDKKVRIEDPITLVEDNKQVDKIYDFFVDLLETTFIAHNTKDAYTAHVNIPSAVTSNNNLKIDESVLKKLNVKNNTPELLDNVPYRPSSNFCCVKEDDLEGENILKFINNTAQYKDKFLLKSLKTPIRSSISRPDRSNIKTQSLTYPSSKRSFSNTSKKKALLNDFKEQLKIDLECFEEPKNLYQALKVIARNKRKHQKELYFAAPLKHGFGRDECMLKRRKIISHSSESYKKKRKAVQEQKPRKSMSKYIDNINSKKHNTARILKEESNESLVVYGFDYDTATKDVVLDSNHTSPAASDMNIDTLLKYTDSDISKHLRSISQTYSLNKSHE